MENVKDNKKIVVTGAAGFIGSCVVGRLNRDGYTNLVLVDDADPLKERNLTGKKFLQKLSVDEFLPWFKKHASEVGAVFHFGACSSTVVFDLTVFERLNLNYTKEVWSICTEHQIPLVYASSAATYGDGEQGYDDDHALVGKLKPMNPYGRSKHDFDLWALSQQKTPPRWFGLKLFNVYGPNESHKGRMASMVFHGFNQVSSSGSVNLFKSHRADFKDGGQSRDFVYVKDVVDVSLFLSGSSAPSGLYNIGTGKARSFLDMQKAIFKTLGKKEDIRFVDIPADIRERYQYFTEAPLSKLRRAGYTKAFTSLEEGVEDYIRNHLLSGEVY
jgi:ADP-L-glycero-D-manno-heptose 6-epimerase